MGFRKFLLHSCFSIAPPYWDFDFYTAFEKGVKCEKFRKMRGSGLTTSTCCGIIMATEPATPSLASA